MTEPKIKKANIGKLAGSATIACVNCRCTAFKVLVDIADMKVKISDNDIMPDTRNPIKRIWCLECIACGEETLRS